MKVKELFDVKYGVNLELSNCIESDSNNAINFVSRASTNNGVVAKVEKIDGVVPQKAGTISCAASGFGVLCSFVQTSPYYSGRDLFVLTPLKKMTFVEKQYYCMCLRENAYRYAWNRQANKTLRDIELPDNIPDWVYKTNVDPIKTNLKKKDLPNKVYDWKEFNIGELFTPYLSKAYHKVNLEFDERGLSYITRTSVNNGESGHIAKDESLKVESENAITVGAEGVVFFYRNKEFICGNKVNVLRHAMLNKYNAMFVVTVLNHGLRKKFTYGRALVLSQLTEMNIPLPVAKNGEPDWNYMENYIKALPYSDII